MPINEKALLRQMKASFKGAGYRVGLVMRGGVQWLVLDGERWGETLPYARAGKELKAQIVSHTGEMPGQPVKAQAEGVQLEVDGELQRVVSHVFAETSAMAPVKRTCLYLGDREIWQDGSGRCSLFESGLTGLLIPTEEELLERIMDGRRMLLTDGEARAFVLTVEAKENQQELLDYLGRRDWANVVEEEADDGQEEI